MTNETIMSFSEEQENVNTRGKMFYDMKVLYFLSFSSPITCVEKLRKLILLKFLVVRTHFIFINRLLNV